MNLQYSYINRIPQHDGIGKRKSVSSSEREKSELLLERNKLLLLPRCCRLDLQFYSLLSFFFFFCRNSSLSLVYVTCCLLLLFFVRSRWMASRKGCSFVEQEEKREFLSSSSSPSPCANSSQRRKFVELFLRSLSRSLLSNMRRTFSRSVIIPNSHRFTISKNKSTC